MIKQFIQVRYASGFPLTPWQVQLINWPFCDETFAAKRAFDEALRTAKAIASVRGLPLATPAHVVVSELEGAGEGPQGFDYNFWLAQGAPPDMAAAQVEVDGCGVRYAAGLNWDEEWKVGA